MGRHEEIYRRSLEDPDGFWAEAATAIDWDEPWERVLDDSQAPFYRWFSGGRLNTCHNALDRHVEGGRADQLALIYDSPVTGTSAAFTYRELRDEVARFAGALAAQGVEQGDRVVIYMPMVPEAVIAMLACARIGAIHSVVFGGFAAHELASRIEDARPKVVVSASCGIEPTTLVAYKPLLDAAIEMVEAKPERCIVLQRPQLEAELHSGARSRLAGGDDPGRAGSVRFRGGHRPAVHPLHLGHDRRAEGNRPRQRRPCRRACLVDEARLRRRSRRGLLGGLRRRLGRRPLLHRLRAALARLHDGAVRRQAGRHPDAGAFWRVVAEHGVSTLFTAPTAFRAIRQQDPEGEHIGRYDLSSFRALFLAGERCDPETLGWAEEKLRVPVIDNWWQTETGWPIASNCLGIERLPVVPGSPTRPVPGWDVRVLDGAGEELPSGETGALVIKLPMPPGASPTLWNADDRFREVYLAAFPGYYQTADAGYIDDGGYLFVMSRTDDIINTAGHRLSTGAIEEVLASHPDVAETAVIGVADELKGQLPVGFLVLKSGVERGHDDIVGEVVQLVRERIGPVAAFKTAVVVDRLPKTRSGKILRGTMRRIADGVDYTTPATIDDPATLDEMGEALRSIGYARSPAATPAG